MSSFLRQSGAIICALGAGALVGVGVTVLLGRQNRNVSSQITALSVKLDRLARDVEVLRELVQEQLRGGRHTAPAAFNNSFQQSCDEDEEFEEATEGRSNFDQTSSDDFFSLSSFDGSENGDLLELGGFLQNVDKWSDGSDNEKRKAYELLSDNQRRYCRNADFLWRLAKVTFGVAKLEGSRGDLDAKRRLTYVAKEHAEKALQLDGRNACVHKWYAILIGSVSDYESTQNKIKMGYQFKEHIEKSIELDRNDYSTHHLFGRWCFGVSALTWLERKVATTLFASPPTSTISEALEHFMEAERLNPDKWKENLLYIAKCHIENRNYSTAILWLDKASALPSLNQDDITVQAEVEQLEKKYSYYREE